MIKKMHLYQGLGFPLLIPAKQVEMIEIHGELQPRIDVRKVADHAMQSLLAKQRPLTGNQIKFMRTYFMLDQEKFAKLALTKLSELKKWEASENKLTRMDPKQEAILKFEVGKKLTAKLSSQFLAKKGFLSSPTKKPSSKTAQDKLPKSTPKKPRK